MKGNFLGALLVALCIWSHPTLMAQKQYQDIPQKTRILFLLDGSGSMLGQWEGTTRMRVAKRLLSDLVDSLKVDDQVELALRVYGHQFHRRLQNCKDSKLEVGFKPNNHQQIIQKLGRITPQGTTPIAYSLEQLDQDFPSDDGYRNIVIIITDGLESCDGDPCAVSTTLQKRRIFLRPFVIGLGMNRSFEQQFDCLGRFFDARDIRSFRNVLNATLQQSLAETTLSVELLDQQDRPRETNINVSFINSVTRQSEFEFVHYRDAAGKPDSVRIDAVMPYDIIANTIPPVVKKNVLLQGGAHNVISLKTPQGQLKLSHRNHSEYGGKVQVLVRAAGSQRIIHTQTSNQTENYLAGNYEIEVLTLPRIKRKLTITANETLAVDIPAPGVLNINSNVQGNGSLFLIRPDKTQKWLLNLGGKPQSTQGIQPGDYKLVFRAVNAKGSKYTEIHEFSITSGSTKTINLFRK